MDLGLSDRACVISGASRGIGAATAVMLAREGAALLLVGRSEPALAKVAERCRAAGAHAETATVNVTDPDAGERIREQCISRLGRIDVLVNNAGTSEVKSLEQLSDADWQAQWDLHVMAAMRLMRAIAPAMAERRWGRIVNVCSSSGKRPSKQNMAYSVSKAAELSLSRAFANEYADAGVAINAIAPGPVGTELWLAPGGLADQNARARGVSREQALEIAVAGVPRHRMATEDEIAFVIVFLCSELAANVVGAAWSVDGGTVPVII